MLAGSLLNMQRKIALSFARKNNKDGLAGETEYEAQKA